MHQEAGPVGSAGSVGSVGSVSVGSPTFGRTLGRMSLERMIHLGSLIEVDQTEVMNWLPQIVKRYKVPMETHGITWVRQVRRSGR